MKVCVPAALVRPPVTLEAWSQGSVAGAYGAGRGCQVRRALCSLLLIADYALPTWIPQTQTPKPQPQTNEVKVQHPVIDRALGRPPTALLQQV